MGDILDKDHQDELVKGIVAAVDQNLGGIRRDVETKLRGFLFNSYNTSYLHSFKEDLDRKISAFLFNQYGSSHLVLFLDKVVNNLPNIFNNKVGS